MVSHGVNLGLLFLSLFVTSFKEKNGIKQNSLPVKKNILDGQTPNSRWFVAINPRMWSIYATGPELLDCKKCNKILVGKKQKIVIKYPQIHIHMHFQDREPLCQMRLNQVKPG